MNLGTPTSPLDEFAEQFLLGNGITHYRRVDEETLAEAVRRRFYLPALPRGQDLKDLCFRMGISLDDLHRAANGLKGMNAPNGRGHPTIYLQKGLGKTVSETTIAHELREVIENAFKRMKPDYVGLETCRNEVMNRHSERFASLLLMQGAGMHRQLARTGWDIVQFAETTGRSLTSVVLRMRDLYPTGGGEVGPVAGLWLFEAEWSAVLRGRTSAETLFLAYTASLGGFTTRHRGQMQQQMAAAVFPQRDCAACDVPLAREAFLAGGPVLSDVHGFDLFPEYDYTLIAEPIYSRGKAWRLLLTAVRNDCLEMVAPWLDRLGLGQRTRRALVAM